MVPASVPNLVGRSVTISNTRNSNIEDCIDCEPSSATPAESTRIIRRNTYPYNPTLTVRRRLPVNTLDTYVTRNNAPFIMGYSSPLLPRTNSFYRPISNQRLAGRSNFVVNIRQPIGRSALARNDVPSTVFNGRAALLSGGVFAD